MKVYKVVSGWDPENETGHSCVINGGAYKLKYKLGKTTVAPPGTLGIFCFRDIPSAKQFASFNGYRHGFLECTATVKKEAQVRDIVAPRHIRDLVKRSKVAMKDLFARFCYCSIPQGTVLAAEITPKKAVKV